MHDAKVKTNTVIPLLQVNSVQETIDFYTDALGFEVTGSYPEEGEPGWCMVKRDDANPMFSEHAVYDHDQYHNHDHGEANDHDDAHHAVAPSMTGLLYFYPDDVDALFERIRESVEVEWPSEDQPHGMREFAIRDCNGYLLVFGQESSQ